MTAPSTPPGEPRILRADDLDLVRSTLRGERRAIDRFLERMRCVPRILAARNLQLGRPLGSAEMEDVVQETLIAVWRKLSTYNGSAALETWVYRFCTFEILKALRRGRRSPGLIEDAAPGDAREPSTQIDTSWMDLEPILEGLESLEGDEAAVVRLKHFEEMTFEELARALGIPTNTAKTRYYRGMRKLRHRLAEKTRVAGTGREA